MRARDATAADLGRLYADSRSLEGVALSLCGDGDAADFMQDVFLRALTRVGTARQYWPLETWMLSIMITEGRRRRAVARRALVAPTREPARETGDGDPRIAAVRSVLVTLPRRQREVAFLRYFADLDEATIAARLGIHRGTVSATLHRVRGRVRQAIDDEGIATPSA